ncbi:hypothetical protein E5288_WYG009304 [Bos mutus]|uniref:Uncharacterized protein n=1 Tax=Bos mutus TaxID=72004 RepID=A0A6B0S6K4_9CETA|nr:hypothetical protein [Bos mutus]
MGAPAWLDVGPGIILGREEHSQLLAGCTPGARGEDEDAEEPYSPALSSGYTHRAQVPGAGPHCETVQKSTNREDFTVTFALLTRRRTDGDRGRNNCVEMKAAEQHNVKQQEVKMTEATGSRFQEECVLSFTLQMPPAASQAFQKVTKKGNTGSKPT